MDAALKNLIAGSVSGISATLICHPLDTIRTRLQTSSKFAGVIDCVRSTAKHEGNVNALAMQLSLCLAVSLIIYLSTSLSLYLLLISLSLSSLSIS
jgi:hypothetical protein